MKHCKQITLSTILLLCIIPAFAQYHDISVGGHAGVSMYFTDGDFANMPGACGGVDIGYAIRGQLNNQNYLGVKIGATLSYAMARHVLGDYHEQYFNTDYENWRLLYDITAETYSERQRQLQVEIPVFLSFWTHGVTINIGAKYMALLNQQRRIDATGTCFHVWYEETDVWTEQYLATGRFEGNQHHGLYTKSPMPANHLLAACEVGYEFNLGKHSRLGLQAYCDLGIWNNYTNEPPKQRLIDVEPILDEEYPVPPIHANALTDTYSTRVRYFSCGVKIYYTFHTGKNKKYICHCVTD